MWPDDKVLLRRRKRKRGKKMRSCRRGRDYTDNETRRLVYDRRRRKRNLERDFVRLIG